MCVCEYEGEREGEIRVRESREKGGERARWLAKTHTREHTCTVTQSVRQEGEARECVSEGEMKRVKERNTIARESRLDGADAGCGGGCCCSCACCVCVCVWAGTSQSREARRVTESPRASTERTHGEKVERETAVLAAAAAAPAATAAGDGERGAMM